MLVPVPRARPGSSCDPIRERHQAVPAASTAPALDDVTVEVEKGEFVFLVGASGSGKSTFLRLVLREARPTAGKVYVAGKEINRLAGWKVPGAAPPDRHRLPGLPAAAQQDRLARTSRSRSR